MTAEVSRAKIGVSRGTVIVACKVPNGLILRLHDMDEYDVPVLGGGTRREKRSVLRQDAPIVEVKGPSGTAFNIITSHRVVGGYGLTPGVDAEFFAEWLRQNMDLDVVRNNMIYAHEQEESTVSFSKENAERHSGMEPMVPSVGREKVDPRAPRSPLRQLSSVQTGSIG